MSQVWKKTLCLLLMLTTVLLSCAALAEEEETDYAALAANSDTLAAAKVRSLLEELEESGYIFELYFYKENKDENGIISQGWAFKTEKENHLTINSNNGEDFVQVLLRTETLTPDEEWLSLCRFIPETEVLALPDGIRQELSTIKLNNGGANTYAKVDDYEIYVGGIMDVRTVWNLCSPDF